MGNCSTKSNAEPSHIPGNSESRADDKATSLGLEKKARAPVESSESESNDGESNDLGLSISKSFEDDETISWPLATQNILSPSRPIMMLQQGTTLNNSTIKGETIDSDAVDDQVKAEMKDRSSTDAIDDKVFSTGMPVLYVNENGVASFPTNNEGSTTRDNNVPTRLEDYVPRRPQCSPKKQATEAKQSFTLLSESRFEADRNKRNEKLKRVPPPPPPPPPPPLSTHPSMHVKKNIAAKRIQALVRSVQAREAYYSSIYSALRIQALVRGYQVRSRAIDKKCQAAVTVDITSDLDKLRRFVSDDNWSGVARTLEHYPEVAEKVDSANGEMLLHMICRHPNVPTSILDLVIVLYPKALRHSDSKGALPLHYAASHDNMEALEIVYTAFKDGVNHVDKEGRQPFHVAADSNATEAIKFLYDEATEQHKSSLSTREKLHKEEVRALEQSLADVKELRKQESAEAKRQIQELETKVQAWVELGILKDVFSKPPPQPP